MYNPFPHAMSTPAENPTMETEADKARITIREILVAGIQEVVKQRRMTHTAASFETRVGRTVITAILNGNLNKISTGRGEERSGAGGFSLRSRLEISSRFQNSTPTIACQPRSLQKSMSFAPRLTVRTRRISGFFALPISAIVLFPPAGVVLWNYGMPGSEQPGNCAWRFRIGNRFCGR